MIAAITYKKMRSDSCELLRFFYAAVCRYLYPLSVTLLLARTNDIQACDIYKT